MKGFWDWPSGLNAEINRLAEAQKAVDHPTDMNCSNRRCPACHQEIARVACRHDYSDGDICSKCDAAKPIRGMR
jgi:hypothetical protein